MKALGTSVDSKSPEHVANRSAMLERLKVIRQQQDLAVAGGGQKYVDRHRERGRLTARERIELLLDRDAPFLELSPLAAWGTEYTVGASAVCGIGVVSDTEVMVIAHDPTVRGGASNPYTWKKVLRAMQVSRENRLPLVQLVESGGGDLKAQAELFVPAGRLFHDITASSNARVPTVALVFGSSTAGGAYVPGMSDYTVMVDSQAKVFLGGPPLVKMATGEESDDEELGGAAMHSRVSGLSDYFAPDEYRCIELGREIVAHLNWRKLGAGPVSQPEEPVHDPEELLGIVPADIKQPFDPREVIARVCDGSLFEEYKDQYGTALVTGWSRIHGYPVGILANARGVLMNEEAQKATEFILLSNQIDTPLVFLQNTTGYMVGRDYEQRGIIKDGSKMINAVSNSTVPHFTVNMAASYGAGNYGMCGRSYDPRLLFTWPNSKTAIMGAEQLAGVMSIVARQSAESAGREFDEEADRIARERLEERVEAESQALFMTGQLHDDGIIDPRDTRSVLGIGLSACHGFPIAGSTSYGVFRM